MTPNPVPRCALILFLTFAAGCASRAPVVVAPPPEDVRRGNSTTVHVLGIPPGQLPRAGQCRVWVQGLPPGRQAKTRPCAGIAANAPAGSWIVYRPASSREVHVHVVDDRRPGAIVIIRHYNAEGEWLRDEQPGNHHDDDDDRDNNGRGRGRRRPAG